MGYSKPELEVASWTVPKVGSGSTQPPPDHSLMSELKKESQQCARVTLNPTKVAKAYKAATGKCTLLRHLFILQGGKMCFSKVPVTQCGPSCKSQDSKMTVKTVEFTCMPTGRQAEFYLDKVVQGKLIPELKNMETSFSSQMPQPSHCVHALVLPSGESKKLIFSCTLNLPPKTSFEQQDTRQCYPQNTKIFFLNSSFCLFTKI